MDTREIAEQFRIDFEPNYIPQNDEADGPLTLAVRYGGMCANECSLQ